jgi:hypothetical protein
MHRRKAIENPATAYKMELYDVRHDWTQNTDVAADNPTRLQEMKDLMFGEFAKYQVLPLDASAVTRLVAARPSVTAYPAAWRHSSSIPPTPSLQISMSRKEVATGRLSPKAGDSAGMVCTC